VSDIELRTDTPFESALARLIYAGEALGCALAHEQELEDDRAAIKADAIKRVMVRDGVAATPAEKVVETDPQYFEHRAKQRASIVERFKADAEYWAAKAEATQASLITPDVFTLEAKNAVQEKIIDQLDSANKELTKRTVALMRERDDARYEAREEMRETIVLITDTNARLQAANADLVQANRELAEQLAVEIATRLTPANAESIP
jgi:hypothetical protein